MHIARKPARDDVWSEVDGSGLAAQLNACACVQHIQHNNESVYYGYACRVCWANYLHASCCVT